MAQRIEWQEKEPGELWEAVVGQVLLLTVQSKRDGFVADVDERSGSRIMRLPTVFADPATAQRAAEQEARRLLREALEVVEFDTSITLVFSYIKNPEAFDIIVARFQGRMTGDSPVQVQVDDAEIAAGLVGATIGLAEAARLIPAYIPAPPEVDRSRVREVRRGLLVRIDGGRAPIYRVLDTEGTMHQLSGANVPEGNPQPGTLGWMFWGEGWHFTPDE